MSNTFFARDERRNAVEMLECRRLLSADAIYPTQAFRPAEAEVAVDVGLTHATADTASAAGGRIVGEMTPFFPVSKKPGGGNPNAPTDADLPEGAGIVHNPGGSGHIAVWVNDGQNATVYSWGEGAQGEWTVRSYHNYRDVKMNEGSEVIHVPGADPQGVIDHIRDEIVNGGGDYCYNTNSCVTKTEDVFFDGGGVERPIDYLRQTATPAALVKAFRDRLSARDILKAESVEKEDHVLQP